MYVTPGGQRCSLHVDTAGVAGLDALNGIPIEGHT
jgi:hypothetical protein